MLEIKQLTKTYNTNTIFKALNLSVADGEVLSIVGPSGIGKTTLIKILAGLETADAGEVRLNGEQLAIDGTRADAKVGLIFQDFNLFPNYTVIENIMLAPINVSRLSRDAAKAKATALLATLGMTDKADLYPYQLSGGQKQRVAIARALIHERSILLVDEGTSALDAQNADLVEKSLLANPNLTLILISHHLSDKRKAQFDCVYELMPTSSRA